MKKIWTGIVKLFGWKFDLPPADDWKRLHHCVLIEAPHTSIYDFLLGAACVWRLGLNGRFFIKKEFFVFPLRHFMRWSGALPIDRGNPNNNMIGNAVKALAAKYAVSYKDLNAQLSEAQDELASLISDLTGDEFAIEGLNEFKNSLK